MVPGIIAIVVMVAISWWFIRFTFSMRSWVPIDRPPPVPDMLPELYLSTGSDYVGPV